MARDKSIDKPMKPLGHRSGRKKTGRRGGGGSGGSGGGHYSPVAGLCQFLLGVILLCLAFFFILYFVLSFII